MGAGAIQLNQSGMVKGGLIRKRLNFQGDIPIRGVKLNNCWMDMAEHDPYSHEEEEEQDTERALSSYSDLFAAISFCFLFLYVVATMQSNVQHIQTQRTTTLAQQQKIDAVVAKYEKLLAAHQLEKDKYLAGAQDSEKQAYEEALKNLHHLSTQEETRKAELAKELNQAEEKSKALSDYQQLIKNIVESNLALKQKVADKEVALEQSKVEFEQKTKDRFKGELKYQVKQAQKVAQAEFETKFMEQKAKLEATVSEQEKAKNEEIKKLEEQYRQEVASVRSEKAKSQQEKVQLAAQLEKLAKDRAQAIEKLEGSHASKVAELAGQFKSRESELQAAAQAAHEKAKSAQQSLAQSRAKEEIHKAIVASLENEFKKNGISATIDRATGEVTMNFLKVYFDVGQSSLKEEMEADLAKFMPAYAKAIFKDKRNSDAIDHIEVIGFASPTFDKKYVDPSVLKAQHLDAVSYNLDLSYKRAKSIFKHIFNQKKLSYDHQDEIFKMTKVAGRSFLEAEVAKGRFPASGTLSRDEYCAQFDCKKQQKVVIKFHLKP